MTKRIKNMDKTKIVIKFEEYIKANEDVTFKQVCEGFKEWEDYI